MAYKVTNGGSLLIFILMRLISLLLQEEAELNLVEVIVAEVDVHVLLVGTDRKQLVVGDHLLLHHL
jgi:hypothetical protein